MATVFALVVMLTAACTAPQPAARGGDLPLAGTHWVLQVITDDAVPRTPSLTIDFGSGGHLSGSDGCNAFHDTIQISGRLAGTLMACADAIEVRARAYREALQRTTRFAIEGVRLRLYDGTGRTLAQFTPAKR